MKSYSNFIVERKKGNTAVASPAPGDRDPLDPSNRKRIDKKFSNPSNPPKVANPEAPKTPKTPVVKQADVSKQAAKYRRAQRVKGATGGKTTGSLSKGNLSFPGDRSGATAKAKSDIAARRGFSGSKSGGLKADETSKFVDRSVRQQRAVKQGIPDPFDPKTPKAPARPFKGIAKGMKSGSPSIPDPFKGTPFSKPKKTGAPERPALKQAVSDIRRSRLKSGFKIVPQTDANKYIRSMQDQGRKVDPDLIGSQGLKASGAKPEMVGGSKKPSGAGAKFRAQADATKDIFKSRGADLDKAIKNLTNTGNVRGVQNRKTSTPSTFKDFSQKAKQFEPPKPPSYKLPNTRTNAGTTRVKDTQPRTINPSTNKPTSQNTTRSGYRPEYKPQSSSQLVKGGRPKVTVNKTGTKPTLTPPPTTPLSDKEKKVADALRKAALSGKDAAGNILGRDERIRRFQQSRNVRMAVPTASSGTSGTGGTGGKSLKPSSGSRGGPLALYKPPKESKATKAPAAPKAPKITSSKPSTETIVNRTLGKIGKGTSRALGVGAAGFDAYSNYRKYREAGDSRVKSGLKSAFRTSLGWLGGAAGSALGSVVAPVAGSIGGGIAGYSAGTWLADKVLGTTKKNREAKKK